MGNTIGIALITFEVASNQQEVREAMKSMGYQDNWKYPEGDIHYLPDNTLCHTEKSSDDADEDLKHICGEMGVKIDRLIVVIASEFVGIPTSYN